MLTKEQTDRASFWVHAHADPEFDADLLARGVVDGLVAAYDRVTALLIATKPARSKSTLDCVTAVDWYDKGKEEAYAEVRRALEG